VIGRPYTDFITPETAHVLVETFPIFKQQSWINNVEFDLLRKDGTSFPVLLSATAVKNEAGEFLMSRSTVFDNTESKQAELALREREDVYRALFQSANDAIFMLSPDGVILRANPRWQDLLGYTADELIGRMSDEFIANVEKDEADNILTRLLAGERLPMYDRHYIRKDGSLVETEVNLSLIRDELGEPKFIQSVIRDISARKRAENALRESEEQNRLLFEDSPDAVVLFDQLGRVVRINHAFETITGRHGDQFIGHLLTEIGILPRQLIEALSVSAQDALEQDGKIAVLEFKMQHVNGEIRDISARIFTLNLHGEPHYLASIHDITTSKRAEETLRLANAEMERALRLKDEFLANMSHELRTPLNAVLGITESLLEQISGPLNEKQQKYLQTVSESAQHLLELINDILDLAKINAGRIDLDINKADIVSIANASLRIVRELAQKKGVATELKVDTSIKLAWVDERRLKQMLVNLLSNAVKFTPEGGSIGLEVRSDALTNILHFTVWDTGIGINPQDLRLLFQPFVQLDAGLARGNQGTGLGLVLVSQMARLHGGSVSVESDPGKGSRFTINLPWVVAGGSDMLVRREHPAIKQNTPAIRTKDDGHIILVVEDTEAVTMLISDYLKQHGYQVMVARDGYEGLARCAETRPDLILMDVMMPELDGLETTRRIRNNPELADVPIIALTALAMAGDRDRCIAAGMNDYLSKPVKLRELLDAIQHHLKLPSGGHQ
jgi:PAS domain S-box-containing protein